MATTPPTTAQRDYHIRFGRYEYPLYVRDGGATDWPEFRDRLACLGADRFLLVTETSFPTDLTEQMSALVSTVAPCSLLTFPEGEDNKTLMTVDALIDAADEKGVTHQSVVLTLGGGLAANIGGFLAAVLLRGVRLVHNATTLLHGSDVALSLKQGVSSKRGKNRVGLFYAPTFVWFNLAFLDRLPREEIRSGLCELCKNVLAIRPAALGEIHGLLNPQARYSHEDYGRFVELCVDAKTHVMTDDPFEKGTGLVLEYGHTVGHALEKLTHGAIPHGQAIAVGMCVAARVARLMGLLSEVDERAHHDLLCQNGVPTSLPANLDPDDILAVIRSDNKSGYLPVKAGHHVMVLLEELGRAHLGEAGLPLTHVREDDLLTALRALSPLTASATPAVPMVSAVPA